jgi:hypothetical protein
VIVKIERQAADGLTAQRWVFSVHEKIGIGFQIHLNTWFDLARPSKRHAFRHVAVFDRLRMHGGDNVVAAQDVPLPDDVVAEAKRRMCEAIEAAPVER